MTRETKVGMVVSCSFLALVGVVLASKMRDGESNSGTKEDSVQAASSSGQSESNSSDSPRPLQINDKDAPVVPAGMTTDKTPGEKPITPDLPKVEDRPGLEDGKVTPAPPVAPPTATPELAPMTSPMPSIDPPATDSPNNKDKKDVAIAIAPPIGDMPLKVEPTPTIAPPGGPPDLPTTVVPATPETPTSGTAEGEKPKVAVKEATGETPATTPMTPPKAPETPPLPPVAPPTAPNPIPDTPTTPSPEATKPVIAPKPSELNVAEPPSVPKNQPAIPMGSGGREGVSPTPSTTPMLTPETPRPTPESTSPSRPGAPGVVARGGQEQPSVVSYEEEEYIIRPGDTYAIISQKHYGSERFADALRDYNENGSVLSGEIARLKDGKLKPGQRISLPPMEILSKRQPAALVRSDPPAPEPPAAPKAPAAPPSDVRPVSVPVPPDRPAATTPALTASTTVPTRNFRVRGNGQTMREVARLTLGNGDRWQEIYHLNPQYRPDYQVPGGVSLKLPAEAKIPSEE